MYAYLDPVDNLWRIRGHESHHFSTEADAEAAIAFAEEYAIDFAAEMAGREYRYRRAAKTENSEVIANG